MKRWIFAAAVLLAALPLPSRAQADCNDSAWSNYGSNAAPVCACYFSVNYCDLNYDTDLSAAGCATYCQQTYGAEYAGSAFHGDAGSCMGEEVESGCVAANATARLAERDQAVAAAIETGSNTPSYPAPELSIDIPGVEFSRSLFQDGRLTSNFLGTYVAGVYRFLIGFALTVAIVMVMVGGLQYVVSASTGDIGKAKERIRNAVVGFVLLLFVYVILFTVNPNLTVFKNLEITVVPPAPEEYEDDFIANGTVATSFATPDGTNITGAGKTRVPSDLAGSIESAARTLLTQGYGLSIAQSFRSVAQQRALIYKNCQNPPGSDSCNPRPGRPTTCVLQGNNAANCPHTTGYALDVWGTASGSQCVSQDRCMEDLSACRANACQAATISAMRAAGFCNLGIEPWHFEKPPMSSGCN